MFEASAAQDSESIEELGTFIMYEKCTNVENVLVLKVLKRRHDINVYSQKVNGLLHSVLKITQE
jgi:methyl coenzyme M reductase subunit C-like uncharacterized protein (methanogenesis marker protein 7)